MTSTCLHVVFKIVVFNQSCLQDVSEQRYYCNTTSYCRSLKYLVLSPVDIRCVLFSTCTLFLVTWLPWLTCSLLTDSLFLQGELLTRSTQLRFERRSWVHSEQGVEWAGFYKAETRLMEASSIVWYDSACPTYLETICVHTNVALIWVVPGGCPR